MQIYTSPFPFLQREMEKTGGLFYFHEEKERVKFCREVEPCIGGLSCPRLIIPLLFPLLKET
jgi:hypothetical protein